MNIKKKNDQYFKQMNEEKTRKQSYENTDLSIDSLDEYQNQPGSNRRSPD